MLEKSSSLVVAVVFGASLVALDGCKGGGGADPKCQLRCTYEDNAIRTVLADIAAADTAAARIEGIEVKNDADIKNAGRSASELCLSISTSIAHARGIVWAMDQEGDVVQGRKASYMSTLSELEGIEKEAKTCLDRSPAQLKSGIAAQVHKVQKSPGLKSDTAPCLALCGVAR
jgi:hypothetical protein